jgi:sialidase-1
VVGRETAVALAVALAAHAAAPFTKTTLWEQSTSGYSLFRIPGIVVTRAGTVLAYTEARKAARSDWGESDILIRRSTDGGRTFSAPIRIGHMERPFPKNPAAVARNQGAGMGTTYNNPVAIADRNGTVHFLFCVEYIRAFYVRSDDDGRTFSGPREITAAFDAFRKAYAWTVLATGPGHGIQLKNGRLLVPVWLSIGTEGNAHAPSVTATVYSDDRGRTWKAGEIAGPDTAETPSPNETTAVQLGDGRVMLNMRSPSQRQHRVVTFSKDGATHWSPPVFDDQLFEPVCFASLARLAKSRSCSSIPTAPNASGAILRSGSAKTTGVRGKPSARSSPVLRRMPTWRCCAMVRFCVTTKTGPRVRLRSSRWNVLPWSG